MTQQKNGIERIEQLNRLLRAIRDVNKLIATETDPEALAVKACKTLVESKGYQTVSIAIDAENDRLYILKAMGGNASQDCNVVRPTKDWMPACHLNLRSSEEDLFVFKDSMVCHDCPIQQGSSSDVGACALIKYEDKVYGSLSVRLPDGFAFDTEEEELLLEIAGDLGLSMHVIQLAKERRKDRELLEEMGHTAKVGGWELDLDSKAVRWTAETARIHDLPIGEYPSLGDALQFYPGEARQLVAEAVQKAIEEGVDYDLEVPFLTAKGRRIWVRAIGKSKFSEGRCLRLHGTFQDVTSEVDAKRASERSEEKYRRLAENSPAVVYQFKMAPDGSFSFPFITSTVEKMMGIPASDVQRDAEVLLSKMDPTQRDYFYAKVEESANNLQPFEVELHSIVEGKSAWFMVRSSPEVQGDGSILWDGAFFDITELKEAEAALVEAERRSRALLDYSPSCHKIVDLDFKLQYMSRNGFNMLKLAKDDYPYGSPYPFTFFPDDFREEMLRRLCEVKESGKVATMEGRACDSEGNSVWLVSTLVPVPDAQGNLAYITVVGSDVTEKKKAESRMRQLQKLESIGTLAGGVAHEINNPINGIMNYAQLIKDQDPADTDSLSEFADEIIIESKRVAGLVKNLLGFARHEVAHAESSSIYDIVERTLSLIRTAIRHDQIEMNVNVPEDLPEITCRSQEVQQVIMNLIQNARDALIEREGGHDQGKLISLESSLLEKHGRSFIRTTVTDSGVGIPKDLQSRIFDPFFTTKSRDTATGLGLSISFRIVKEHGGDMFVESEPGNGAKFFFDLPIDGGESQGKQEG